jgi:hypothetical protein
MDIFAFLLLYMSCTWTLADLKIGSLIVAISLLALCLLTRSPRGLFWSPYELSRRYIGVDNRVKSSLSLGFFRIWPWVTQGWVVAEHDWARVSATWVRMMVADFYTWLGPEIAVSHYQAMEFVVTISGKRGLVGFNILSWRNSETNVFLHTAFVRWTRVFPTNKFSNPASFRSLGLSAP